MRYRDEILTSNVVPYAESARKVFIFVNDNARPHIAMLVTQLLVYHGIQRMGWLSKSPELLPMEHFWDIMGKIIGKLEANTQELQ